MTGCALLCTSMYVLQRYRRVRLVVSDDEEVGLKNIVFIPLSLNLKTSQNLNRI